MAPDSAMPPELTGERSFQAASATISTTAAATASSHGLRQIGRAGGTGIIVPLAAAVEEPLAEINPDAEFGVPLAGTASLRSAATRRSELVSRFRRRKSERKSEACW